MYRFSPSGNLEIYLAHPGGPFFSNKDEGYWGIPKGLLEGAENEAAAAKREFEEETGYCPPAFLDDLGSITLKSGKRVHAFAVQWTEAEDPPEPQSNTFPMEWPPRSGREIEVPEIDRAGFFNLKDARKLMNEQQWELVERLQSRLSMDESNRRDE